MLKVTYCCTPSSYRTAKRILRNLTRITRLQVHIHLCLSPALTFHEKQLQTLFPQVSIFHTHFLETLANEPDDAWIMWGQDEIPTEETLERFTDETETYGDSVLGHAGWIFQKYQWRYINYHYHEARILDGIQMTRCKHLRFPKVLLTDRERADYWFEHKVRLDIIVAPVKNHQPKLPCGRLGPNQGGSEGTPPVLYKGIVLLIFLITLGFMHYPRVFFFPFVYMCYRIFIKLRHLSMNTFNLCWWLIWYCISVVILYRYRSTYLLQLPPHLFYGVPLLLITTYVDNKKHWHAIAARKFITLPTNTYIPKFKQPVIYVLNYPSDFIEHSVYTILGENVVIMSSGKMEIATCFIDSEHIIFVPTYDKRPDNYRRTVRLVKAQFEKNCSIMAYPENHYWDRASFYELCPFRTGLFRIAQELNVPIVPVVVGHFENVLGMGDNELKIEFLKPIWVTDPEKDTRECQRLMGRVLKRFRYTE